MLSFEPITVGDRAVIQPYLDTNNYRNCDYSFANLFGWQQLYTTTFVKHEGWLFVRFQVNSTTPGYLFPLGSSDLSNGIELLMEDAAERGVEFRLFAVTRKMYEQLEEAMPGRFSYTEQRDLFDYVYSSDDLIHLVGKKYQPKRNHINKFKRSYRWEYLPITRDIIPECWELYQRWCRENGNCDSEETLIAEQIGTQRIFDHYETLGLTGGALRIDGEILAYSYGSPLTPDTFGIHAEKSLTGIDGGFAMMNQQFAEYNCADYLFINREEDLGLDSLRQAKLSYQPAFLLEKGVVKPR